MEYLIVILEKGVPGHEEFAEDHVAVLVERQVVLFYGASVVAVEEIQVVLEGVVLGVLCVFFVKRVGGDDRKVEGFAALVVSVDVVDEVCPFGQKCLISLEEKVLRFLGRVVQT